MAHPRTEIRNYLKTLLTGAGSYPWQNRVFVNRPNPLAQKTHQDSIYTELPALLIYTKSGTNEIHEEAPREYMRNFEVVIEIAAAMDDNIDDTLDQYSEIVEMLVLTDPYLGGNASDTTFTDDALLILDDGELPIGAVILTFDVMYLQNFPGENEPQGLDDLDTVFTTYRTDPDQDPGDQTEDEIDVSTP